MVQPNSTHKSEMNRKWFAWWGSKYVTFNPLWTSCVLWFFQVYSSFKRRRGIQPTVLLGDDLNDSFQQIPTGLFFLLNFRNHSRLGAITGQRGHLEGLAVALRQHRHLSPSVVNITAQCPPNSKAMRHHLHLHLRPSPTNMVEPHRLSMTPTRPSKWQCKYQYTEL